VGTNLARISVKARANPDLVFTSLYHHIADIDHLRTCYHLLKGNKAVGVDEVTKAMYADDLEANLHDLSARLKRMGYRPQPKRRVYIPKPGSEKGRPLGISSFEDKIVELATKRVLEPLFESLFEACSYGYRPQRNQHQCLGALGRTIQQKRVNYLVEADIRGFFDAVNHEWLLKFLGQRIGDQRVLRLISRMLKAGIMEDGLVQVAEVGTPQGSILSALLSNVYLHYVLDLWFQRRVRRQCRGEAYLFRFADDFLACFQYPTDAEAFLESLGHRMEAFHLELAEEKTRLLEFGRYARGKAYRRGEKPKDFEFLGMTFFGGKTRQGAFKVKRKTSRKKLKQALARFTDWIRRCRHLAPTGDLLRQARARIEGHLNYYAITDNSESCHLYLHLARRALYKWLNRRSQRTSYTWDGFLQALGHVGWPQVRVRVNLNPFATPNG
jgi:group II intron reverse transcriptase/maturase